MVQDPRMDATALGQRLLYLYSQGNATDEQLLAGLNKGWITQAEYDEAYAARHPEVTP